MKLFLQKNAKFSSAGGSAPRPPNSPPLRISGYAPGNTASAIIDLATKKHQKSCLETPPRRLVFAHEPDFGLGFESHS